MARFLYDNPVTGLTVEHQAPCGEAPATITLDDGVVCHRNLGAEIRGRGPDTPAWWPKRSNALAVHPSQRLQFMKFAAEHGVPTDFDHRGRPEFESAGHQKRYAELEGAHDFDGGYNGADSRDKGY